MNGFAQNSIAENSQVEKEMSMNNSTSRGSQGQVANANAAPADGFAEFAARRREHAATLSSFGLEYDSTPKPAAESQYSYLDIMSKMDIYNIPEEYKALIRERCLGQTEAAYLMNATFATYRGALVGPGEFILPNDIGPFLSRRRSAVDRLVRAGFDPGNLERLATRQMATPKQIWKVASLARSAAHNAPAQYVDLVCGGYLKRFEASDVIYSIQQTYRTQGSPVAFRFENDPCRLERKRARMDEWRRSRER